MAMDIEMEREMLEVYQPRSRRPEDQVNNLALAQMRARGTKTWEHPDKPGWFLVRGHEVQTQIIDDMARAVFCDCPSFRFRITCRHVEAVNRRLGFDLMG